MSIYIYIYTVNDIITFNNSNNNNNINNNNNNNKEHQVTENTL